MADHDFKVPPEVLRYFADKNLMPKFSYLDVWAEEHSHALSVAKAVDAELLATFRNSIQRALEKGQGFESWRKDLQPELERLGWWKPRKVSDPEGIDDDRIVDFSSPRRLETIFWSNIRTAQAAGQWERAQRSKGAMPFFLYIRSPAAEPRPEHLTWVGLILPVDHEFWKTHFPPNGWGCLCAVRQISRFEAERLLKKEGYTDQPPPVAMKPFLNRRTGQVVMVPQGIDPGWDVNPGLNRAQTLMDNLQYKLENAGEISVRRIIEELWNSPVPELYSRLIERVALPVAVNLAVKSVLKARSPLIMLSTDTLKIKTAKHANVSLAIAGQLQNMIDQGQIIDENRGDDQRTILVRQGKQVWKVVIKMSKGGFLRVSTIHEIDEKRAARLIRSDGGRS